MANSESALPIYKLKNDAYRKRRGRKAKLIDIYCVACGTLIMVYQKDMPRGILKRCYLDRIFYPMELAKLQKEKGISIDNLPRLQCSKCKKIIGTPMRYQKHGEDRLAYNMIQSNLVKKNSTHGTGRDR